MPGLSELQRQSEESRAADAEAEDILARMDEWAAKYASELDVSMSSRYLEKLNSAERKEHPLCSGVLDYFPDALAMVAHVSWAGNEKHNPGEPLHHARGKSMDHADCIMRHHATRDEWDVIQLPHGREIHLPHRALVAWRALAELQEWMEDEYNLLLPRGAKDE